MPTCPVTQTRKPAAAAMATGSRARPFPKIAPMRAKPVRKSETHCEDQTTLDALEAATRPVLFTHATCRALVPGHLRAKTDDAIRRLAKTGGVMGILFIRFLVRDAEPVTIEHVLDQFDHLANPLGVEHQRSPTTLAVETPAS
jgi:membrane dipeptidase